MVKTNTALAGRQAPDQQPKKNVVRLHPDQSPEAVRRARKAINRGPDYDDGKTVRVIRSKT